MRLRLCALGWCALAIGTLLPLLHLPKCCSFGVSALHLRWLAALQLRLWLLARLRGSPALLALAVSAGSRTCHWCGLQCCASARVVSRWRVVRGRAIVCIAGCMAIRAQIAQACMWICLVCGNL